MTTVRLANIATDGHVTLLFLIVSTINYYKKYFQNCIKLCIEYSPISPSGTAVLHPPSWSTNLSCSNDTYFFNNNADPVAVCIFIRKGDPQSKNTSGAPTDQQHKANAGYGFDVEKWIQNARDPDDDIYEKLNKLFTFKINNTAIRTSRSKHILIHSRLNSHTFFYEKTKHLSEKRFSKRRQKL